jgi:DNA polymerase sigma
MVRQSKTYNVMLLLLKTFLSQRSLLDRVSGGFGSTNVSLLLVYFLRVIRAIFMF